MNYKTTAALLALFTCVGVYFLVFERNAATTHEREADAARGRQLPGTALFTADQVPTESVVGFEINAEGADTLRIDKQGQDWFQTQPVRFGVNTWSAKQLADAAAALRYLEKFTPGDVAHPDLPTLQQASLSPPLASLTLVFQDGDPPNQVIHIGRKSVGGRGYVMINDAPYVYVVNDTLHKHLLDEKPSDWRKRSVGVPGEGQAQRVTITHSEQTLAMAKSDGRWVFENPDTGRVGRESITSLLNAVGTLYIKEFEPDNPQDLAVYGLDQPATTVQITWADWDNAQTDPATTQPEGGDDDAAAPTGPAEKNTTGTLAIGSQKDLSDESYFAAWSVDDKPIDVVFVITKSDAEKFHKTADDHRDRRITPAKATDVRELTIERAGGDTIRLLRGPGGWSFAQPDPGFEIDSGGASSLVESITDARADSFQPAPPTEPADPIATIALGVIGQAEPETLRVYPGHREGDARTHAVLRNDERVLYHVPAEQLSKAFEPVELLRQRTVLDAAPASLTRVMIEHPGGPRYVFDRDPPEDTSKQPDVSNLVPDMAPTEPGFSPWRLAGHERFELGLFNDLLAALLPLRAKNWLAATHNNEDDQKQTLVTVTLEQANGKPHVVLVDLEKGRAVLVGHGADQEWFEMDSRAIELLGSEFRDRTLLPLSVDQIKQVTVISDDDSITVRQGGGGRYVADTTDRAIDQTAAGALFDTLAGLRVERFIEPAHVSEPPLKVLVETQDGRTHRLAFSQPQDGESIATNGDLWFILNSDTVKKLTPSLEP